MAHNVDHITVSCIDFRFRAPIAQWIKDSLNDQSDLTAVAGASKAILDEDTQASVLKQIELAQKLHDIKTVHIVDHIDCGAYGGSDKFQGDKAAEVVMHQGELKKAAELIVSRFPGISIETHIIDFGGMV